MKLAALLLLFAVCGGLAVLQAPARGGKGGVYSCLDSHTSSNRSCSESRLSLLAGTELDFRAFAEKICNYLKANATMVTHEDIDQKILSEHIDTKTYQFFQYVLLVHALQKELPKSYSTLYSGAGRRAGKVAVSQSISHFTDLWLEMGVEKGYSLNVTSIIHPRSGSGEPSIVGFDWFQGLPVEWFNNSQRGDFSNKGVIPPVKQGVELVVGLFNETVPKFLTTKVVGRRKKVAFVNIDNDLYEGARDVLLHLSRSGGMRYGAVIHFHELIRRRNESARCFGQEELLGLYDAMRINPNLRLELLPYRNRYFQNVLFRYLTRRPGATGRAELYGIPSSTAGDAASERVVMDYVKKNLFVTFTRPSGDTVALYEKEE